MLLPQKVVDNVNALYNAHKDLANGDDNQRRTLTKMIAEQNCYDLGIRWGTKKAGPGNPQSKDAIAYLTSTNPDVIDVWDWQNGNTRKPQVHVNQAPDYPELRGQYFILAAPINHLGNVEPQPPDNGNDDADIMAMLALIKKDINELKASTAAIMADLDVIEKDTADILKKCQEILDKPIPPVEITHPDYLTRIFGQTITSKPKPE